MKNKPKVSVIIPCYNHGQYIDEAVNSVLNQTFQDLEIIIINDGSTDEFTNKLLENYSRPKTIVYCTENKGLPAARNFAISKSIGEFILPLDADDLIMPEYIAKAVKVLLEKNDIGFVTPWVRLFGEENYIYETKEFNMERCFEENVTAVASIFRKKVWEDTGGYDEKMIGYQDWDFWISASKLGWKNFILKEDLFHYRKRSGSMLTNSDKNRTHILEYLIKKHKDIFDKYSATLFLNKEAMLVKYFKESISRIKEIDNKNKQIQEVLTSFEGAKIELKQLKSESDQLKSESDQLKSEIDQLKSELARLRGKLVFKIYFRILNFIKKL